MNRNRKRWTKILMGVVCGVMLTIVSTTGWTQTAFVCEGRIGNAATNTNSPLAGDFEYDIGPSTAAPAATGQFAWQINEPVNFYIQYDAIQKRATFGFAESRQYVLPQDAIQRLESGKAYLNIRVVSYTDGATASLSITKL